VYQGGTIDLEETSSDEASWKRLQQSSAPKPYTDLHFVWTDLHPLVQALDRYIGRGSPTSPKTLAISPCYKPQPLAFGFFQQLGRGHPCAAASHLNQAEITKLTTRLSVVGFADGKLHASTQMQKVQDVRPEGVPQVPAHLRLS
jgi:hypothetical protein